MDAEPDTGPEPAAQAPTQGPLVGVTVLDLTRLYPGPLGTMILADMGADVIKIEDVSKPDYMRHYPPYVGDQAAGYLATNRGKRALALKLGDPDGVALLKRLAQKADVLVEGFRPGVMKSLGLGYQDLKAVNPKLIYVSVTGYGQDGPYVKRAGHDLNYIGYAGILDTSGKAGEGPTPPGVQLADVAGGAYMSVIGILAALQARTRTDEGQFVDVAMLDGVMPLASLQLAHQGSMPQPPARGEGLLSGGVACYGVYETADGKHMALGALEPKFWQAFCALVEKPDWVQRHLQQGDANTAMTKDLKALFKSKTRDEWVALVGESDTCLSPVLGLDELDADPQIKHRGLMRDVETPNGNLRIPGAPIKFSGTPNGEGRAVAPAHGQDTRAVLSQFQLSDAEIQELADRGLIR